MTTRVGLALIGATACACGSVSTRGVAAIASPPPNGTWTGVATTPGAAPPRVVITLWTPPTVRDGTLLTLLEHAFMEGSADFIGEMTSGSQIGSAVHRYGFAHEQELWQEFRTRFDSREFSPWMYGRPNDGRPNDLGYFIGYRIAQAFYARSTDKAKAIHDISVGDRAGPAQFDESLPKTAPRHSGGA